jgi:hypothetical protein
MCLSLQTIRAGGSTSWQTLAPFDAGLYAGLLHCTVGKSPHVSKALARGRRCIVFICSIPTLYSPLFISDNAGIRTEIRSVCLSTHINLKPRTGYTITLSLKYQGHETFLTHSLNHAGVGESRMTPTMKLNSCLRPRRKLREVSALCNF